jgi:polyphosphate kinase
VKFLSILSSNLDEFFMVRVAGLMQQTESGVQDPSVDGRLPGAQLAAIGAEYAALVDDAYRVYHDELLPALADSRIHIASHRFLDVNQKPELDRYFRERIYPVLTPLAFDRGRPFPHISNLSLNLAVVVRDHSGAEHFALVKVPDSNPQLVPVEEASYRSTFLWLEELIVANLALLFPGLEIVGAYPFHVTRDGNVYPGNRNGRSACEHRGGCLAPALSRFRSSSRRPEHAGGPARNPDQQS